MVAKPKGSAAVVYALCPGAAAMAIFFGLGVLSNICLAISMAVLCEYLVWRLKGKDDANPLGTLARDREFAIILPGFILALALPPGAPWWLLAVAVASASLLAKHAFGGSRNAIVNPAMFGYLVVLVSYPAALGAWPPPSSIDFSMANWIATGLGNFIAPEPDAVTMATPLDVVRHNTGYLLADLFEANPQLRGFGGAGWQEINLAFCAGGVFLMRQGMFRWQIPIAVLVSLSVCALLFYDEGSSASGGSPLFHLLSGGTMLGAFFIATEPNSSPTSDRAKLLYGAFIGILIYAIRVNGDYPDGVAWAVLIANVCAPLFDEYERYRSGRSKQQGQRL